MTRTPIFLTALLALTACAAPGEAEAPRSAPAPTASPARPSEPVTQSFSEWQAGFRARAAAAGVSAATLDRALAGVTPNPKVVELDNYQPEFTRPIWEYLDSAVSESRVANGRAMAARYASDLARIEANSGVDRNVVLAIWGLESAYGSNRGSMSVIRSLATLAWEGRRRDFAEEQLIEAMKIIDAGDVTPEAMLGSWAGAMGHTQFIPTSFSAYAVDYDGDGRRNIWGDDPRDALASTANYLSRFGWKLGVPWGVEARLPAGFDYALADQSSTRPVSAWRALGVTAADGSALPDHGEAAILLPAGAHGPSFALYSNFNVIRRYNNATSYALAVGHLSDRIGGAGPFRTSWPRNERPLSRTETQEMQRLLTGLGHDTDGVDGIIGPNSRSAIRNFQREKGMAPDGYASEALLTALRQAAR